MKRTKEQKSKHSSNGITLIALIITIIVMLILVAVTISMAINGGLFNYAGKAVGDTKNAIALEQELSNGRIQIGGVWYDSIDDYLKGIPSGTQTQEDIIIKGRVREENGATYIDLQFSIAGIPPMDEYLIEYAEDEALDFIDYNIYPDKTITDLEEEAKDLMNEENDIDDEFKDQVIIGVGNLFGEMLGVEVVLPYEQSLRVYMYFIYNENENSAMNLLMELANYDMMYCYACEIIGIEPCYEATDIENQFINLMNFDGTFEELAKSMGTSKTELQTEAEEMGITYGMYLKMIALEMEEFGDLIAISVTVSNGDTFNAYPTEEVFPYEITEEGTYTFKATMIDGRKGEATIKTNVTNPYDENGWVMAWTWTDGEWSTKIEAGNEAEGDVVVKVYETGKRITPDVSYLDEHNGEDFQINPPVEGSAYSMVIEGTGDLTSTSSVAPWSNFDYISEMTSRYLVSVIT